jgi:phosphatidylglycerophosphate synthase
MISYALVISRFLIGPLLYFDARDGHTTGWFIVALTVAFVGDVLDGVIARRTKTVTARLRELDGVADVWLYLWISICAWSLYRDLLMAFAMPLILVLGLQCLAWAIDLLKYRRFSNYHAYSAKAWGITLFAASIALFGFRTTGLFFWLAIVFGVICILEEIAITLTLPVWTYDVPSVLYARRLLVTETP